MKVRQFAHELVLSGNPEGYERSPGLHMSDLYNSMYKRLDPKRYDKRGADGQPEEMDWAKVSAGMGFESRLEPQIAARYGGCRPGEMFTQHARDCGAYRRPVKDGRVICACGAGIAYSPDWLFDDLILGEFKFSWYSSKNFPHEDKFAKWMCQVKAYLYHLKMSVVWVFPYWVNGTYPRGGPPSPSFDDAYEITFTERELGDNWKNLLKHARKEKMVPA